MVDHKVTAKAIRDAHIVRPDAISFEELPHVAQESWVPVARAAFDSIMKQIAAPTERMLNVCGLATMGKGHLTRDDKYRVRWAAMLSALKEESNVD